MLRKLNTWYSVRDGNWNDPGVWISNGKKRNIIPQSGDTVYINHNIIANIRPTTIKNLYLNNPNAALSFSSGVLFFVTGDVQIQGTLDVSNVGEFSFGGQNNSVANLIQSASSSISYISSFDQTILPFTYSNLILFGGDKYLTQDLTVNSFVCSLQGSFGVVKSSLKTNGFNFLVNGNTVNGAGGYSGVVNITSNNNITFVGTVNLGQGNIVGNATLEFRNGLTGGNSNQQNCNINFTTNNQTISANCNCTNVNIVGAIIITINSGSQINASGTVNGTVAGSTLNNNGTFIQTSASEPMVIGVWNYNNTSTSIINYNFNGNYNLPHNTFSNLIINGSGVKTLTGSTTIISNLNINAGAKLELSSYDLSVNGTTTLSGSGGLSKSGSGTIIMVGMLTTATGFATNSSFSGNPTWELRGGATIGNGYPVVGALGTGAISFTTNNQTFKANGTLSNNIIIGSGITLVLGSTGNTNIYTGTINGVSGSSILDNRDSTNYQNGTAPMAIGKLYCNQASNTWIYGANGNQDITVPQDPITPGYYNLMLNGTGAKRLLGNVSVQHIYSASAQIALNTNGYYLSNP